MCKTIQIHGFPSNVSAEEVMKFLEQHAGFQTVLAVEIKHHKDADSMTHVNVQFTDKKCVETILNFVTKHLSYSGNVLNATLIKPDILSKPRIFAYNMDGVGIHFGCQTSKGKLSVLWEHSNASVKFGARLRKMYIFFRYLSKDYKMQINSESISRIEMHHSHCRTKKLFLFQVSCFSSRVKYVFNHYKIFLF